MSMLSHCIGWVTLAVLAAQGCGSDVTTEDDATSSSAASGAAGSTSQASSGSTSSASSSSGAGGAGSCENVEEYIANLYQAASACSPADPSLHCQDVVDGYCCPVVVESIASPATQAYLDFLALTKQQCPELWERCSLVDCGVPQPGNCVPDSSKAGGHCSNRL